MNAAVSAVLFVKDCARVTTFYRDVFDARTLESSADHTLLECSGFQLTIHQIPRDLAKEIVVPQPVERRERNSLRLDLPVANLERSRVVARLLGGTIDDAPPPWAGSEIRFHLGHDPEGNVFGAASP